MIQEIEQKLRLSDGILTGLVKERCRQKATKATEVGLQRDEYFDTASEELRRNDLTVRIRSSAGRTLIALKGPRLHQKGGIHRRIELEFEIPNDSAIRFQLREQGLVPTAVIEKRRSEFSIDTCFVAIDTLPFIGSFVEIEGPDAAAIDSVRESLGLSVCEAVKENYTELIERAFATAGRPVRPNLDASFASESFSPLI